MKPCDPARFGLPGRTVLEEHGQDHFVLVINRKSRIIMADGRKILAKADSIRKTCPDARIDLATTAPVCSKTRDLLAQNNIEIIPRKPQ